MVHFNSVISDSCNWVVNERCFRQYLSLEHSTVGTELPLAMFQNILVISTDSSVVKLLNLVLGATGFTCLSDIWMALFEDSRPQGMRACFTLSARLKDAAKDWALQRKLDRNCSIIAITVGR